MGEKQNKLSTFVEKALCNASEEIENSIKWIYGKIRYDDYLNEGLSETTLDLIKEAIEYMSNQMIQNFLDQAFNLKNKIALYVSDTPSQEWIDKKQQELNASALEVSKLSREINKQLRDKSKLETKDIESIMKSILISEECSPKKIDPNDLKLNNCGECEHGCFNVAPEIEVLADGTRREYHGVSFGPQSAIVWCNKKQIQFDPKLLGQFYCESMTERTIGHE